MLVCGVYVCVRSKRQQNEENACLILNAKRIQNTILNTLLYMFGLVRLQWLKYELS